MWSHHPTGCAINSFLVFNRGKIDRHKPQGSEKRTRFGDPMAQPQKQLSINLTDRVAVITEGSRGIGRATVKAFADAGAGVVFSYLRSARAARELARAGDSGGW